MHGFKQTVTVKIQVDAIRHEPWITYKEVHIQPNETFEFAFPTAFQVRWIRFLLDTDCKTIAMLTFE